MPDHVASKSNQNSQQIQQIESNKENVNDVTGSIELLKISRRSIKLFK